MEDVERLIRNHFNEGLTNTEICHVLETENNIKISNRTLRRRLNQYNLRRRNVEFIDEQLRRVVQHEISSSGGNLGYRSMCRRVQSSYGILAPSTVVRRLLRELDPEGVAMRSRQNLRRRVYTNKGPNFLIHIDGYDKLKKFGLCIHGAIDGYSKKVLWLKVGHTNNDPKYVAWYFMQYLKDIKGVPRCIRMDRGTENTLIEDIEISFRQCHTDDMSEKSVLYGSSNHNQPIERWWRTMRQMGIQYYMDFFQALEVEGNLETGNSDHMTCVRYCFQHIIQQKLDEIRTEWNTHRRRPNSLHAGGIPNVLFGHPELRGDVDYKTEVGENDVIEVELLCEPPKDPADVMMSIRNT